MTILRTCVREHDYVTTGNRSKCSRCGAVQVDLTESRAQGVADATKVFGARRPTLFSLKPEEAESEAAFGRARHRR
ncbi:MAG TPA: hypothetical protein VFZ06_03510 [Acidimicrobiia bacterium]|nr:hypothetical protein [Acidimicrobiia bacterium]